MKDSENKEVAVKVSKINDPSNNFDKIRLERFKTEAIKVNELYKKGQQGIVPVLHYELPCKQTGKYFFVMPKAIPLMEIVNSKSFYEKIEIFKELAKILMDLHSKGITHRDIKPENILFYNGKYCFGDFGLIDFPEKEDLTGFKEWIGNRKTMAPEMRNARHIKDSRPADVYSFAKTLWIVLSEEELSFDGQFNYYENNKLELKYPKKHFVELYKLLSDSTAEDPLDRPTIEEFVNRLIEWENISKDEGKASISLWRFIEEMVIHQKKPSTVIWRNKNQIVEILKKFARFNFNHTFIHEGGGMDLIEVSEFNDTKEDGMISFDFGLNNKQIFKVKRLVWELPNEDPEFSYFRLELEDIPPIFPDAIEELSKTFSYINSDEIVNEDLIINSDGDYEPYWEDDEYGLFHVTRWFRGSFIIVHNKSIYNKISATYDGRHSKFNADDFREYMEILQYVYNHNILKPYFWEIASWNPHIENNFEDLKKLKYMSDDALKRELNI